MGINICDYGFSTLDNYFNTSSSRFNNSNLILILLILFLVLLIDVLNTVICETIAHITL